MIVYKLKLLLWIIIVFVSGFLLSSCQHEDPRKYKNNKIYFLSNRDAPKREFDIFSMNLDGTHQVNLTRHISGIRSFSKPCISHDGKTVLFVKDADLKKTIQSLCVGDGSATTIAEVRINTPHMQFSPDDKYILFTDKIDTVNQIFLMKRDGSSRRKLSQSNFDDSNASYSPDGKKICYQTKLKNTSSIGIMNIDGSQQYVLTDDSGNDMSPSFSPDGSHILFSSDRNGTMDIFMINLNNNNITSLYNGASHDRDPIFMPDGDRVIFCSNTRGKKYSDLVMLNINTGETTLLTDLENKLNQNPLIIPNSNIVLFESSNFLQSDIMMLNLDDLNYVNLTNNPQWDLFPVF